MRKLFLFLTLPLFVLDQLTKQAIVGLKFGDKVITEGFAAPTPYHVESRTVIPGFFDLVRVHNTGVAFGMANGAKHSNWIFGGISVAAMALIGWLWRSGAFPTKTSRVAVGLLLSGVLGNLFDRLARGYVVDFLHFDLNYLKIPYVWPSFNVADAAICIAAGLLFFSAFQKTPEPAASGDTRPA